MPLTIPEEFKDPTTGKLMNTAVQIVKCGHILDSYNLANKTIFAGSDACPCKGCTNTDLRIIYPHDLQRRIDLFKSAHAAELKALRGESEPESTTQSWRTWAIAKFGV